MTKHTQTLDFSSYNVRFADLLRCFGQGTKGTTSRLFLCVVAFTLLGLAPQDKPTLYATTSQYETRDVEGWRVTINKELLTDEPLANQTLKLLRIQLHKIDLSLPTAAVKKLKKIRIWVEKFESHHPCMVYHPSAVWLRDHGMNPEKGRCVEISNARNFLDWATQQPYMVLHELAHGYHDQYLSEGYNNPTLKNLFNLSRDSNRYDAVSRVNGRTERAYALNNPMEFFAEATEAFFGTNDFYPFVRAELQKHDPDTFATLRQLWDLP